jgi:hypothetical protein
MPEWCFRLVGTEAVAQTLPLAGFVVSRVAAAMVGVRRGGRGQAGITL